MDNSSKNIIRSGIILLWIFLFAQYFFSKNVAEPYPAIVFPAFSEVLGERDELSFTRYEIYVYTKNDSLKVNAGELFNNAPSIFHGAIIRTIKNRQEVKSRQKQFKIGIYTYELTQELKTDSVQLREFRTWLKDNIRVVLNEEVNQIGFFNYQYTYNLNQNRLQKGRKSRDQFKISI